MNLLDALNWRYATKRMNGDKIPKATLENILEAIRLAPSSFGLTPYNLIVIEDETTRKRLQPHFYNQPQIAECSTLLIFANWISITEKEVDIYISEISEQRGISIDALSDFANYIKGSIKNKSQFDLQTWASKQTYIALGVALVAAAEAHIDATPMEGFNPAGVNDVLKLGELGLNAAVAITLGYRDANQDYMVNMKKVRREISKLVIKK